MTDTGTEVSDLHRAKELDASTRLKRRCAAPSIENKTKEDLINEKL